MSKNPVERTVGSRNADSRDIHDIRSLTATGAITLPDRPRNRDDEDERGE